MIDLRLDDRGDAGRVATVVIDNAPKLNCLSKGVRDGLIDTFQRLGRDERLRAVVLTGAGDRAFAGGADVRELAALRDEPDAKAFITEVHRCCHAVRQLPVPVIARVRGYALGAGLELAASCDIRVASDDSHFGMPEVKIGLPSVIEAALLPQLIGWGRARYLVLTGETVAVADARDWGMFDFVVPPDQLDGMVEEIVAAIVESGPRAVRTQKALVSDWERLPVAEAVQRGIHVLAGSWGTDEPRRLTGARLTEMRARRSREG